MQFIQTQSSSYMVNIGGWKNWKYLALKIEDWIPIAPLKGWASNDLWRPEMDTAVDLSFLLQMQSLGFPTAVLKCPPSQPSPCLKHSCLFWPMHFISFWTKPSSSLPTLQKQECILNCVSGICYNASSRATFIRTAIRTQ